MYSGGSTFIPLRVNSAGVIPIIFAISILLLPSQVAQYFTNSDTDWLKNLSTGIVAAFQNTLLYNSLYFVLVVVFTFFYTAFTFIPNDVADNIKRYGGFIPGIRPGRPTSEYLTYVLNRITLPGSLYLGLVAVLPTFFLSVTSGGNGSNNNFPFGGTAVLIMVGVGLDTIKQIESQLMQRNYEGFLR